jgi:hypothetical protein
MAQEAIAVVEMPISRAVDGTTIEFAFRDTSPNRATNISGRYGPARPRTRAGDPGSGGAMLSFVRFSAQPIVASVMRGPQNHPDR